MKKFDFKKQNTPPILGEMPRSEDAEKAVLGCLLLNPDELIPHAADHLPADSFYGPVNRTIFEELISFGMKHDSGVDLVTFSQHLIDRKKMDQVGGPSYISSLLSENVVSAHYGHYAKILGEKRRLRAALVAASGIIGKINASGDEFSELSASVLEDLASIRSSMESVVEDETEGWGERVDGVAGDWTSRYQGKMISAVSSPWPSWDRTLGGVRKGYNLILGAKKTGKSSLMGHLALHLAVEKKLRTKIFTYETPVDDYIMRLASNLSGVRGDCIFSPDIDPPTKYEIGKISDAFSRIAAAPLSIVKGNGLGVREISREAKKFNAFFVVVDYLLLLPRLPEVSQKEGTEGAVRANSCALIELSREIDGVVCVINHTASSGDRKGESRWGDQPENDADMTLLVDEKGITVKSRRNGEAGAVMPIKFHGETYSFREGD